MRQIVKDVQCNQASEQKTLFSGFQRILAYKIENI